MATVNTVTFKVFKNIASEFIDFGLDAHLFEEANIEGGGFTDDFVSYQVAGLKENLVQDKESFEADAYVTSEEEEEPANTNEPGFESLKCSTDTEVEEYTNSGRKLVGFYKLGANYIVNKEDVGNTDCQESAFHKFEVLGANDHGSSNNAVKSGLSSDRDGAEDLKQKALVSSTARSRSKRFFQYFKTQASDGEAIVSLKQKRPRTMTLIKLFRKTKNRVSGE